MKILLWLLCGVVLGSPLPNAAKARDNLGYPVEVTSIYDGDTFTIDGAGWTPFPNLTWKVRIGGIDTPERHSRCAAERQAAMRARDVLVRSLQRSQSAIGRVGIIHPRYTVWLRGVRWDKYGGRLDATVLLSDGRLLNDVMIEAGVARAYFGGHKSPWCKGSADVVSGLETE